MQYSLFQEDFLFTLKKTYNEVSVLVEDLFCVVCVEKKLFVSLIPIQNNFAPLLLLQLQQKYQANNCTLVHLWEDVWMNKKAQVLSRITSFCGNNSTVFARKMVIDEISAEIAKPFLEKNHLQGYVRAKHKYGMFYHKELLAVACFSDVRPMPQNGEGYQSAELVRFATLAGKTIVGGLGKCLKHFLARVNTQDVMTYADRDWSLGKGYDKLNFIKTAEVAPSYFYVDSKSYKRYAIHRLPKNIQMELESVNEIDIERKLNEFGFVKVFNTGNLKYHLYA